MPTNHLGQQTTDSGHVIKESERIATELSNTTKYGVIGPEAKKDLVKFIMDYSYKDYAANVKFGVQLGRKDAGAMFLSAFEAELRKTLDGTLPAWADETIEIARRAVDTVIQDTEGTA